MQRFFAALVVLTLTSCSSASYSNHRMPEGHHMMHDGSMMEGEEMDAEHGGHDGMVMEKGDRELTAQMETGTSPTDLAFSIREHGKVFTDFGVMHEKEMHFILIRDDLRHFAHLHPERDAGGIWHIDFTPAAGGTYWLYADFADAEHGTYTPRFTKTFDGPKGEYGLTKDFATTKTVDGYRVTMEPSQDGTTASFAFTVMDASGKAVTYEPYLGAIGHAIFFTTEGDVIHTHAEAVPPVFMTDVTPDTFYRIEAQFQINGQVITAPFDWQSE